MDEATPLVRTFGTVDSGEGAVPFGEREIRISPAVERSEGRPLSAYSAVFGRGERADLPAPYEEIWIVIRGHLRIRTGTGEVTAGAGQYLHIPEDSPGEVEAIRRTTLVCVSVPAH